MVINITPTIRIDLTNIPKLDTIAYRRHITEIIAENPHHTICYTDGLKSRAKTGYAYSIQDTITAKRIKNSDSVFTAQLSAIHSCLSHLTQRPPRHDYILLTDLFSSLLSLQGTY